MDSNEERTASAGPKGMSMAASNFFPGRRVHTD